MESDSGARHAPGHQRCQDRCHEYTALALCHVTSGRGTVVAANTLATRAAQNPTPWLTLFAISSPSEGKRLRVETTSCMTSDLSLANVRLQPRVIMRQWPAGCKPCWAA
jgi:hypothetical protein